MNKTRGNLASRILRDLAGNRRGVAAAEFGLILPTLVGFFAAAVQYGTMYATYNTMVNSARSAARSASLSGGNLEAAKLKAEARRPSWVEADDWVVVTREKSPTEVEAVITVDGDKAGTLSMLPTPDELRVVVVMDKEA